MTREFPDRVTTVGDYLTQVAGSYLHSVTRGDWQACATCAVPVDGYDYCVQCQSHRRSEWPIADRAGFLVYADEPSSQTYRLMRGYKEPRTREGFEPIVAALLAVGLRGHFKCAVKLSGLADFGWAIVPSTKGRPVFANLVRSLTIDPASEVPVTFTGPPPDRGLRPQSWSVRAGTNLPSHVVVIDDAWVSGSSSQSLASALKQAGATQVSILTVARVLSPNWAPNRPFLRTVLPTLPYDWTICPWTPGDCP